jgi:hypothetical protein
MTREMTLADCEGTPSTTPIMLKFINRPVGRTSSSVAHHPKWLLEAVTALNYSINFTPSLSRRGLQPFLVPPRPALAPF